MARKTSWDFIQISRRKKSLTFIQRILSHGSFFIYAPDSCGFEDFSNVQKITSAENLLSRVFDDLAIELNINCNRKIAEVIF